MLHLSTSGVLALAVSVCFILPLILFLILRVQRWYKNRPVRKPRRRDATPIRFQRERALRAFMKRVNRGLRYPTAEQKRIHFKLVTEIAAAHRKWQAQREKMLLKAAKNARKLIDAQPVPQTGRMMYDPATNQILSN